MNLDDFQISYTLTIVLLVLALSVKIPTFLRAWRHDADIRATTTLIFLALAVFVSVTPTSIEWINDTVGVPNIAAPWGYSLLTAFCANCLTMIIRWREGPTDARRRKMRLVYWSYSGIIVALWLTFLLADVPDERILDLDTYYANTPWMREHILLYLIAHMISALAAAYMIGTWFSQVEGGWLRTGLVFLQVGYAFGLVFDILKLIAVGARWTGTNWDVLSTKAAPPFALLDAVLVAVGFILAHAGPHLQERIRDQRDHHRLRPLATALRTVTPVAAQVPTGFLTPISIRLIKRQQRCHDSLLRLAPHMDHDLYRTAYEAALTRHGEEQARAIAGAVTIQAAVTAHDAAGVPTTDTDATPAATIHHITDHIDAISRALRHPRRLDRPRPTATTQKA
ncbi:MAB_1171c family putative transporter [Streptomyces sp. NPDC000594]|uniref:MAB_1171c family putative transporter n=1 Tax=Streptomyces sp. NPDC000594 TaxID=3154261 RepID=UPI00333043DE